MNETENKIGEWEKQNRYTDLSSIKEKQTRQEKKQILSSPNEYECPTTCI